MFDPRSAIRPGGVTHPENRTMSARTLTATKQAHPFRILIVGGGVMALAAALELTRLGRRLGLRPAVSVFEPGAFGGGRTDRVAAPRCQLWLHTQGTIYVPSQPAVSLALQHSTRRLRRLCPQAFGRPPAFAI